MTALGRALACRHPRLRTGGYLITESIHVEEWACLDCDFAGDSTFYSDSRHIEDVWRDHLVDMWLAAGLDHQRRTTSS